MFCSYDLVSKTQSLTMGKLENPLAPFSKILPHSASHILFFFSLFFQVFYLIPDLSCKFIVF